MVYFGNGRDRAAILGRILHGVLSGPVVVGHRGLGAGSSVHAECRRGSDTGACEPAGGVGDSYSWRGGADAVGTALLDRGADGGVAGGSSGSGDAAGGQVVGLHGGGKRGVRASE